MFRNRKKEQDFMTLIQDNEVRIYRVCRMFAKQDDDYVSDLFNEVVLRLWEEYDRWGMKRFCRKSSVSTWVSQISYNTALSFDKRYAMKNPTIRIDTNLAEVLACDDDAEQGVLDDLIQRLNPIDQRIIRLYLEGESYRVIGDRLGMTETAVGSRMPRVVEKMKKMVNGE